MVLPRTTNWQNEVSSIKELKMIRASSRLCVATNRGVLYEPRKARRTAPREAPYTSFTGFTYKYIYNIYEDIFSALYVLDYGMETSEINWATFSVCDFRWGSCLRDQRYKIHIIRLTMTIPSGSDYIIIKVNPTWSWKGSEGPTKMLWSYTHGVS